MPRMPKKRKLELSFFLNERGRVPLLFVHYSNISIQKMYGKKNP